MIDLKEQVEELVAESAVRPAGTEEEHQAALMMEERFSMLGLQTDLDEFPCPNSLPLTRIIYSALGFLAGLLAFAVPTAGTVWVIFALIALALVVLEVLGITPLDGLIGRGVSQNVVGRYLPEGHDDGDPRSRKVIIVAHYDTVRSEPQGMPLLAKRYGLMKYILLGAIVLVFLCTLLNLLGLPTLVLTIVSIVGLVAGLVPLIALVFTLLRNVMPYSEGANDNASGTAVMLGIADHIIMSTSHSTSRTRRSSRRTSSREDEAEPAGEVGSAASQHTAAATMGISLDEEGRPDWRGRSRVKKRGTTDQFAAVDAGQGADSAGDDLGATMAFSSLSGANAGRDTSVVTPPTIRSGIVRPRKAAVEPVAAAVSGVQVGEGIIEELASGQPSTNRDIKAMAAQGIEDSRITPRPSRDERIAQQIAEDTANSLRAAEEQQRQRETASELPAWWKNVASKKKEQAAAPGEQVARSQFADLPSDSPRQREDEYGQLVERAALGARGAADARGASDGARAAADGSAAAEHADGVVVDGAAVSPAGAAVTGAVVTTAAPATAAPATGRSDVEAASMVDAAPASADVPGDASAADDYHPAETAEEIAARIEYLKRNPFANLRLSPEEQTADEAAAPQAEQTVDAFAADGSPVEQAQGAQAQMPLDVAADIDLDIDDVEAIVSAATSAATTPATQDFGSASPSVLGDAPDGTGASAKLVSLPFGGAEGGFMDTHTFDQADEPEQAEQVRERLVSLPTIGGFSEKFARVDEGEDGFSSQAGFDMSADSSSFDDYYGADDSLVSATGSFQALGSTGVFEAVDDTVFQGTAEEDLYIQDADDSTFDGGYNDFASPAPEVPKSRRSLFGGRRKNKKNRGADYDQKPNEWLDLEDGFDARQAGADIGSWDNFGEDDNEWRGGAYGGETPEDDLAALKSASDDLLDKEVWFVALGASSLDHAGMKAFLDRYGEELRNALIIDIECVGAGDLCFVEAEGKLTLKNTDERALGVADGAIEALGTEIPFERLQWRTTDAFEAAKRGFRALSLIGLDEQNVPVGWHWKTDTVNIIDEQGLQEAADVVMELVKIG